MNNTIKRIVSIIIDFKFHQVNTQDPFVRIQAPEVKTQVPLGRDSHTHWWELGHPPSKHKKAAAPAAFLILHYSKHKQMRNDHNDR